MPIGFSPGADLLQPVGLDGEAHNAALGDGLELLLQALQDAGDDLRERIRQLMIGVFTELGQDDPLASTYRRRLASALY